MTAVDYSQVLSSADMRRELPSALRRFREGDRTPVAFGSHRKAEGVVLSAAAYEDLLNLVEDLQIAAQARERIAAGGHEVDFGEWAHGVGMGHLA